MKKILFSAALLLVTSAWTIASTTGDRPITQEQLPLKAQQFVKQYFAAEKIASAQQDTDRSDGDYEVRFDSSSKVEFRKNGEWKEVDCKRSEVPAALIPASIKAFVAEKHPNTKIVEINRERRECEVRLSDKIEVKFNSKGNFLRYDN